MRHHVIQCMFICLCLLQSVPASRCLVTVQAPVHTPVRTCGNTLSVYQDPAPLGVLALLDRSGHYCLCVCACGWIAVIEFLVLPLRSDSL